jgi:1-pyrroline-5-carboxylate dehydrogenase
MQVLQEASLPEGAINFVPCDRQYSDVVLEHPALSGVHFTGSYETLVHLWQRIGAELRDYNNFPPSSERPAGRNLSSPIPRQMSTC